MRGCLPNSYTLYSNPSEISIGNRKFLSYFYNYESEKPKNLKICRLPHSAKVKQSNRKFCMWRECFSKLISITRARRFRGAPLCFYLNVLFLVMPHRHYLVFLFYRRLPYPQRDRFCLYAFLRLRLQNLLLRRCRQFLPFHCFPH